ncbi:hypothetical protein niasHT_028013 [Heterodera trifolii]|uniref:Fanconi-associated nuclease n=1 Tax=Heterodera trifolii TaxID=157864 RepID=A0ABD2KE87_9BILA
MAARKLSGNARKGNGKSRVNVGHSEQCPGSLELAFKKASLGRICKTCKRRVAHAIYQRHLHDCKISEKSGDGEDDIIFCGIFQSSQVNESQQQQRKLKTERRSNSIEMPSSTNGILEKETILSPIATTSKQNKTGNIGTNFSEIPILEVHKLCLHCLERFIGHQQSFAIGQNQWNSQQIDKENFSRDKLTTEEANKSGEANQQMEDSNCSLSLSQQMHQKIEKSPPEEIHSARYSLRILWKILQRVLLCPEHRLVPKITSEFWGEYLRTLLKFLSLPVETQQLFVLLLKRRWAWHLLRDVREKYSKIILGDFAIHFEKLLYYGLVEKGSTSNSILLRDALLLMKKPELLQLCKKFQINGVGQNISTIIGRFVKLGEQQTILGGKREQIILRNIRSLVGEFYRIECEVLHLFSAFFTVYSPTYMDSARLFEYKFNEELNSHLIFTILQFEGNSLAFPSPSDCHHSLLGILGSVEELMNYVKAKHTEQSIIRLLNRQPPAFEEALECAKNAKEQLINEFLHSERQTRSSFYCGLSSFHRRFTAPWVLCRCIFKGGAEVAQKLRNYEFAVELLEFLLETDLFRNFCMSSRGKWYERIALNLERHLKNLDKSAHFCRLGMADEWVGKSDKLILQHRLTKMNNRKKQTQSQTDLGFVELEDPEKMEINGTTLAKSLGDGEQVNHFYIPTSDRGEINKCSVEELVLHHFITMEHFTHGFHSEGAVWHSLFRLFFTDIIFDADVPQVWLSQIQDDPLDLNFPDFYRNRKEAIDQRLHEIRSTRNLAGFSHRFSDKIKSKVASNSHILWHNFQSAEQIATFLACCSPLMLHDLFKEFCTNFRESRSGFPDLVVWNENAAKMAVVEVKGPNDSLSTKQQLRLHFFRTHGVRSVVCHVVARNDRML